MSADALLEALDPDQREVALALTGPVCVLAGAGTGKTRVITHRIAALIKSGIRPPRILAVTFTNKAAREMKSRASALIGPAAGRLAAGTFHHFANLLIRGHSAKAGLRPNFTILDEEDSRSLLKQAVLGRHVEGERVVLGGLDVALARIPGDLVVGGNEVRARLAGVALLALSAGDDALRAVAEAVAVVAELHVRDHGARAQKAGKGMR